MRTACALAFAAAAFFALPANAAEVCDTTCVGPLCNKNCVRESPTVGRSDREKVIIEEKSRRPPEVVIEEKRRRPGVEIEVK